jgi:hypothetical protein
MDEEALETHLGDIDVETPADLGPVLARSPLEAIGLAD